MSTRRHYRRRFLNRRGHHAGAYAIADIRTYRGLGRNARSSGVDATLTLSDCSRIIDLDFNVYDEASARNALYKADLLRTMVDDFVAAYEKAVAEWRTLGGPTDQ